MEVSIHIDEDVIEKAQADHLLYLLQEAVDHAARAKAGTYYPEGSLLAMLPSNADLEKAQASVISESCVTDYANLVPLDSGLRPLFEQKASLHRAFLAEAIANIQNHAQEISRDLLGGAEPTRILALSAEGADSHNGSRHTMVVATDAGSFLYKPRSLKPDVVIKALCDELFPGMFCVPQAIDCTAYGFSEYIQNADPVSSQELEGYFTALGTFCALGHFLSLSDQHAENFLARGAQLAPIDLETTLASTFKWMQHGNARPELAPVWSGPAGGDRFACDFERSITATGMLSCKLGNLYGTILAGTSHRVEPIGKHSETYEHKEQVMTGFKQGYRTCLENKDRIREAVQDLSGTRLRVLLESTMYYHVALKRLFNASAWAVSDGVEALERSLRSAVRSSVPEPVLMSEAASMLKGDYPAFYFIPEGKGLYDGNGIVDANFLGASPLSIALERLDSFDEADMRFESCILEKAIDDTPLMTDASPDPLELPRLPLSQDAARAEAARILELTYEDIVPGKDSIGGLMGVRYGETTRSAMGCSLSTGYAGVGVFAAACIAANAGSASHAEALLGICLHELDRHVRAIQEQPERLTRWGLGLADGVGGIIRALQLIWRYTADPRVPSIYETLLRQAEAADITTAQGCNVYNGLAGLCLPLATEIPRLPGCMAVEKIADALLDRGSIDDDGHRVWTEADGVAGELGYGKGTGGIGLALLRAWQATGRQRFWDACCDAIAYEDAGFDAEVSFWPLKAQARRKKVSPPGICRGVAGQSIVFTQAAQAGVPLAQPNIERARTCALALPPEPNDNLCCGSSAIAEALIVLGSRTEAGRLLHAQVNRRNRLGNYITENTKRSPYFNPNLFYGCLGVGYELLRYSDPEMITSIFA